jgi:hypothetical protein
MSYIIYSAKEKRNSKKRIEKIEVEIFMWRFDHPAKQSSHPWMEMKHRGNVESIFPYFSSSYAVLISRIVFDSSLISLYFQKSYHGDAHRLVGRAKI